MGKPIGEKHAIEVTSFIVAFERPFDASLVDALPGLQTLLKDDYPTFNTTNVMQVKFTDGIVEQENGAVSGCQLQRMRDDGRPAWVLKVEGSAIVVSCADYTRWDEVSSKALSHIKTVLNLVNSDTNAVVSIILQVVDRFVTTDKDGYSIGGVFNTKSNYFTKQVLKSGQFWHVYQGWFDESLLEPASCVLNVLNLSTADTPNGIASTIDYAAHLQFKPVISVDALTSNFLRRAFDALHFSNKSVVTNLLNAKQRKAVGL